MIELQHIIDSKREVLRRETYSRNPTNYSEGMETIKKTDTYNTLLSRPFESRLPSATIHFITVVMQALRWLRLTIV